MSNFNYDISNGVKKSRREHIYYNVRIENAYNGVTNETSQVTVYNKQIGMLLDKQSDYEVAVASWYVRAQMPILIATIKEGTNTDVNAMPFKVCYDFTTGGVTTNFSTELIWTPDSKFLDPAKGPLPKSPNNNNGLQDLDTNPGYYWCTKYATFVDIMNTALTTSYNAFNAAHPGIHNSAVYVQYDEVTGLFGIVAEASYATAANPAGVFFDALLYRYIDTVDGDFFGFDQPGGKDYQITFKIKPGQQNAWSFGNHYAGVVPNVQTDPPDYIIMQQETDSRYLWSNIKKIQIATNSISVREEYMPYGSFPQQFTNQNFANFNQARKSILSNVDYNYGAPNPTVQSSLARDIYYDPKFYKYIDLLSDDPLTNINLEMFYVTEDGRTLTLNLPSKAAAEISLVFRRKT